MAGVLRKEERRGEEEIRDQRWKKRKEKTGGEDETKDGIGKQNRKE